MFTPLSADSAVPAPASSPADRAPGAVAARPPAALPALIALIGAMLLALAVLPAPAQAHDTLIGTDPEDGATLETSPEQITLTYSANILDVSPVVRITDEAGETLTEITPRIEGPDAIAELEEPLPAGTHTVQWRVVSSDGHPIEGTFDITVEQDPAPEDTAAEDETGGPDGEQAQGSEPAPEEDAPAEDTEEAQEPAAQAEGGEAGGGSMLPLLLGVIGVAVVGVGLAAFFGLRRRRD